MNSATHEVLNSTLVGHLIGLHSAPQFFPPSINNVSVLMKMFLIYKPTVVYCCTACGIHIQTALTHTHTLIHTHTHCEDSLGDNRSEVELFPFLVCVVPGEPPCCHRGMLIMLALGPNAHSHKHT